MLSGQGMSGLFALMVQMNLLSLKAQELKAQPGSAATCVHKSSPLHLDST